MHKQRLSQANHTETSTDTNQTTHRGTVLSPDTQEMLDCLRAVAAAEIERKHRLGHYVVVWQNNRPMLIGEDAPLDP
jgi:2-polyprenyl-6-methoxyphenol hydroxylase-like FAD-dependent oxidoreductase